MATRENTLILFDVDGTLTVPRLAATQEMHDVLKALRDKVTIGIVGGSDLVKQVEQLGASVLADFDFVFAENGLAAYEKGQSIGEQSFKDHLGEEALGELIDFTLSEFSKVKLPKKRGTFVEYRKGMLNLCPIGRSCSQDERREFFEYDKIHKIREALVEKFTAKFGSFQTADGRQINLKFSIGGEISFDAFPVGWDKTFCLQYVEKRFENILFFGDKTAKGGNDFEIYNDPRVKGYTVVSYQDTIRILKELYNV
ncbi:phosphomannomutase [Acrasis kona]|uniref:Phosphomannomutase n=1 Tax=Acrasis kona TaxID=1008807 RepID=A0AAW2YJY3_9EUKA